MPNRPKPPVATPGFASELEAAASASKSGVFHIHLVSDSTGETLEAIVSAALVQFEGVPVRKHYWPLIRSALQMKRLMKDILEHPGLVLYTLVNPEIREEIERNCQTAGLPVLAIMDPVINLLADYFGRQAGAMPGRQHMMDSHYFQRIDALHYTMAHDDGQMTEGLPEADIVLVGVSRTSKTPTSIYLANKGYKTANVPFVPGVQMPKDIDSGGTKFVIGLTTSAERLVQIRTNRILSVGGNQDSQYAALEMVEDEIKACRRFCGEHGWPVLDVTRRSIEETAAAILSRYTQWQEKREEAEAARAAGSAS